MNKLNDLSELSALVIDEETGMPEHIDPSLLRNYSKTIAVTIGFLLGVKEEHLGHIESDAEKYQTLLARLNAQTDAVVIRALNNIRSNLILHFKGVSRSIRVSSADYTPLDRQELFKEDFKILSRQEIGLYSKTADINEYLRKINAEILKRIDGVRGLFPDWVDFRHIRFMFDMQGRVEDESKKYQVNQNYYPFKRYFYWVYPEESGNILATDSRILSIIYSNDGDTFLDENRVKDASNHVKQTVASFIEHADRIQIFVDGENVDPYSFAAAIYGLEEYEIQKIDKIIVYYDDTYSSRAWKLLQHFVFDVPVEAIPISRIKETKSLVDPKLVAGISRSFYRDNVTSFILASSDSDFWAVMEEIDANYLLMVEREKCSYDFRELLRKNNIFYCYIDKFQIPPEDKLFKTVFCKELEDVIEEEFSLGSGRALLDKVLRRSYADVSEGVYNSLYTKYIKGLTLTVDKDDVLRIHIP